MYCSRHEKPLPMEIESIHEDKIHWICRTCGHKEEEEAAERPPIYNDAEQWMRENLIENQD